jgi:hypothetical protein
MVGSQVEGKITNILQLRTSKSEKHRCEVSSFDDILAWHGLERSQKKNETFANYALGTNMALLW